MDEKPLSPKEVEAIRHIRNALVHSGQAPSVRQLQRLLGYRSPRSAADILDQLAERNIIRRQPGGKVQLLEHPDGDQQHARTVDVPLVGNVACGTPIFADENIEAKLPVSIRLARPPHRYFILRAVGDSMDAAGINDRDLVLVRQQSEAENGDRVVALIDNEATIKLFRRSSDAVVLAPKSRNKKHHPILLTEDFLIQGVVIATIPVNDNADD